ncbi:Ribosome-assembly protein 3 domain containing protein [Naviculisporaceae sp. PSN 640]
MADQQKPPQKTDQQISEEFTSYYLQRVTKEFAEDLDKVRNADDFKSDAMPLLISALQQGAALFSPDEQRRIVTAEGPSSTDADRAEK